MKKNLKFILKVILIFLPWKVRRFLLIKLYNYKIHPTARIGLSFIYPKELIMEANSYINHFNVAIHLDKIYIGENSTFGRSNWITGFPTNTNSKHFKHQTDRKCELIIGRNSSITQRHYIDCTSQIIIGDFVIIAGFQSQLLTHSVNIYKGIQDSNPIIIGDYCFVGSNTKIFGGSIIPSRCVVAAGAVYSHKYSEELYIYGGVPARPIKKIPSDAKYFKRNTGYIY